MKNDHFEKCKAVELPPIDPPPSRMEMFQDVYNSVKQTMLVKRQEKKFLTKYCHSYNIFIHGPEFSCKGKMGQNLSEGDQDL